MAISPLARFKEGHWLLIFFPAPRRRQPEEATIIVHQPVLVEEVIKILAPQPNENFIDATVGLGGHAREILEKTSPRGRLLAIDQDKHALAIAKENLSAYGDRVSYANSNFAELGLIIREWEVKNIQGILFDLGVSSLQLNEAERGFSFKKAGPLDMRMSEKNPTSAASIVNRASYEELSKILFVYGEEKFAREITKAIIRKREQKPIEGTLELAEIVREAIPQRYRIKKIDPATKTFQALRIATNDELAKLESGLKQALGILAPKGRIAVISFHSLEDRIVKNFFRENSLTILNQKPILAGLQEIAQNPRARSAKLRVAQK